MPAVMSKYIPPQLECIYLEIKPGSKKPVSTSIN